VQKRLNTPKVRDRVTLAPNRETDVARLTRDRDKALEQLAEALEQQTATSEVLRVISSSPGELKPVFDAMLQNATHICEAKFGTLYLREGEGFRTVAAHNAPPAYLEARTRELIRPAPDTALGGVAATKRVVHIADIKTIPSYVERNPFEVITVELGGYRTVLAVPMLKNNELIGVITINRQEVRPFTDKQIALVQNFAAQAVIAIENARLLSELRESLEQQTATSDVLRVISSSPGELQPVFNAMLENATRICEAKFGALFRFDGNGFELAAHFGTPPELVEYHKRLSGPFIPASNTHLARVMRTKQASHTADYAVEAPTSPPVKYGGARSTVDVPMLKDGELVGAFSIYRQEVRPFTDKQRELLENFAAQAVIAIENTRLLGELRESLEQQTATADVLRIISSSPGELEPVFQAILENATHICEANFGMLFRLEDGAMLPVASLRVPEPLMEFFKHGPHRPSEHAPIMRVARTKEAVHVLDFATERAYLDRNPAAVAGVELGGIRTNFVVPLVKDNELIGAFAIFRQEVRPFSDKQIELVKNFAAQAVIAIENARLLNELRERTQEVVKLNQQLEQRVADQVGEIERMGRLRRFLPPQVADLIVASGTEKQLESHRREITALFCDLRGFTGFSESSDPEDVMALLAEYHAAIGTIINKYSGTLERYAGDGVMVIFNDPVPVENPALQAVLMALDMRTAIGGLIEKWRDLGHDLGFGIGIAHGFATLGTIGFEGRRDYAAIGTVSNVASRLCDEAKPGQILISPRVRQAVDKAATVESVGEFELKGIRRPMTAYNVLAASSSKSS